MGAAITLLDGGMGRELERMGAPFRQPEWSALPLIEGPDYVRRAHAAFIAAGAQVITTNSYAVVPFHLGAERFAAKGLVLARRPTRRPAASGWPARCRRSSAPTGRTCSMPPARRRCWRCWCAASHRTSTSGSARP